MTSQGSEPMSSPLSSAASSSSLPRLGFFRWDLGARGALVPQDLSQAIPFPFILSLGGSVLVGWALQFLLASLPLDKHSLRASKGLGPELGP